MRGVKECWWHIGAFRSERGVWWAKRGVWLATQSVWGRTDIFGGEKGCRGYDGVFEVQMECFGVFVGEQLCLGLKRGVGV